MPRPALSCLLLLIAMLWAWPGKAQLPSFQFETITSRDGLPSNTVLSATRDRSGFMWFGTRLCPVRYNGTSFQSFLTPETKFVSNLAIDTANQVWIASDLNGVCRIDPLRKTMIILPGVSDKQTGDFFIDTKGRGWFSDRRGVNRMNLKTGEIKHYAFQQTTFVWTKASFAEDADGTLWAIGRDNGLFRYDAKADSMVCVWGTDCQDPARREQLLLNTAHADRDGFLWIGSYNLGLIQYNTRTGKYQTFATGQRRNEVRAVEEGTDEAGHRILWIGNEQTVGVFRPDQKQFYFFAGIMDEPFEVHDIFRDAYNDIVWICTSRGIVKYHPRSNLFQGRTLPKDLVRWPVDVNVVLPDERPGYENIFYLGLSHTGVLRWDKTSGAFSLIRFPKDAVAETRWMTQRDDGTLWIGTNRTDYVRPGIFVYDLKKGKFIESVLSTMANTYFSVPFFMYGFFDRQDRLWLGNSDEGVHILDEKLHRDVTPWSQEAQQNLLKDNNLLNALCTDRQGKTWLGTYGGLMLADEATQKFIPLDPQILPDSIADHAVNSILEDHAGSLWVARWGSLTKLDAGRKIDTLYTTANGFYDRENRGLAEDRFGQVWMGNYEGLYCIFPTLKHILRFTVNDGLRSNNTAGRLFTSHDKGLLFVGQTNGFNFVDVRRLQAPVAAPPLAISSFRIHEKEQRLDFNLPITLARNDNSFTVDFVALNFRKQHDNQYAYYLEGFEQEWNHSGAQHQAYYTNLNPGHYTLHLKAGDVFGNWHPEELKLQVTVLPAFYETWWFRTLVVLAIAALLYALYRYRINQLLRLQHMRNRISADLHDELGSSLSSIGIMGTLAQNKLTDEHPSKPFLERMVDEVQQISGSLDDIVWNISPKNDALSSLIARMTRYSSELFEAKQISYRFSIPEHVEQISLTMEQRRNFYLVFKESVNNLVKYSQCTKAAVAISIERRTLLLTIEDNGRGFDPAARTDRNGIYNLRERASRLRGTIDICSEPGKGTLIVLRFPLKLHDPKGLLKMTRQ